MTTTKAASNAVTIVRGIGTVSARLPGTFSSRQHSIAVAVPPTIRPVRAHLSPRLAAVVDALPLQPYSRVLEIGCGSGAAARAVAARLTTGHLLAIDRSAAAIAQAEAATVDERMSGRLGFRRVAAEEFVLDAGEEPFDLVFAVRVGALDGRHPGAGQEVLRRIAEATTSTARLFIDGGDPLRELSIPRRQAHTKTP
jgi:SAM-dependent methyltransferase